MLRFVLVSLLFLSAISLHAQTTHQGDIDSLKSEITKMKADVMEIELNLATSENKFKRGIFVATLGYSTVITGGLMLGRKNDQLGKGLLVAGGMMGVVGTVLLVDSFKYLGKSHRRKNKK